MIFSPEQNKRSTMLRNYIKTAWRNLWKNKFYTSINIAGLAIGLAVGLIILLWVNDEKSYDRFHSKQEEIYRVVPRCRIR